MIRPDTVATLAERRNGSLRGLAQELGFPPSFAAILSDVLRERHRNVSLKTENRLRVALGLEPIATYEVSPCPDCGLVHTGRCYGKGVRGQVVVIDPERERIAPVKRAAARRRRFSISISPGLGEQLNKLRRERGLNWEQFLSGLLGG